MRNSPRRTAPKVQNGQVQKKNRTQLSNHYSQLRQTHLTIDRRPPGKGFRHYLTIADVKKFIEILPDWEDLSVGLDAIVLAEREECLGWHWDGVVAICAWERELTLDWDTTFVIAHEPVLDRLGVRREAIADDPAGTWVYFDENSIKGFQLMHILLHELGHHHDRMTTRSKERTARGEKFAEAYAMQYSERLWDDYFKIFDW